MTVVVVDPEVVCVVDDVVGVVVVVEVVFSGLYTTTLDCATEYITGAGPGEALVTNGNGAEMSSSTKLSSSATSDRVLS